jgi:hypothetical protein
MAIDRDTHDPHGVTHPSDGMAHVRNAADDDDEFQSHVRKAQPLHQPSR